MIKLAIIGTNWITEQFIDAAKQTGEYQLAAVYSRNLGTAQAFAEKHGAMQSYDSLEQLRNSDIDAVYIASPNSFHGPQAIEMMKAGKHVIVEKPMASNHELACEMFEVAQQQGVVLMEAHTSPYIPNFKVLKSSLGKVGKLRKANIQYCQYSSRYQKYLNGENPNTFNPAFANGSIMDIGFYCVAGMVALFGEPKSVQANATLLESGVDGHGSVVCDYGDFDVVLTHSKINDSFLPSEIMGEEGTLQVEMISIADQVRFHQRNKAPVDLSVEQNDNRMFYEAQAFAERVKAGEMDEEATQRSLITAKLLNEIRQQTGVVFPTDK